MALDSSSMASFVVTKRKWQKKATSVEYRVQNGVVKLSVNESFRDKSGRRTAAVQDASRELVLYQFRQVLDCGREP